MFGITGVKSNDPLSPNYVPSIFSFVKTPEKRRKEALLKVHERRTKRSLLSGEKSSTIFSFIDVYIWFLLSLIYLFYINEE